MLNLCVLSGNLGADPEVNYTQEGHPIANFNLAFNSSKDKTGWIKVTCFKRLAEVSQQYLHKGARVAVTGILEQERWETNGETRTGYKLLANTIEFIKTKSNEGQEDLPF